MTNKEANDVLNAVPRVVYSLIANRSHKATKYLTPKLVVNATRRLYAGKLPRKGQNVEIVLTIGRPNYAEREFIKNCKLAREPFPVRGIILKFPPKKRK